MSFYGFIAAKQRGLHELLFVQHVLKQAFIQEAQGQLLTGHDGISKTKEMIKESYFWPNMDADIAEHIKACQRCQKKNR
jgi:hypothetical protein